MLPDATRHRWAFVLADEVIATAMLNAYGWDALETYLPKSVDKGIDSLTMPNDTWCQARCDGHAVTCILPASGLLCQCGATHHGWSYGCADTVVAGAGTWV